MRPRCLIKKLFSITDRNDNDNVSHIKVYLNIDENDTPKSDASSHELTPDLEPPVLDEISSDKLLDDKISDDQKLPEHDTRMAVFSCFAAPHEATESYISWKVNNAGYKGHWLASPFDKLEIQNLAEKKGVTLDFRGIKKYRELSELC